MKKMTEGDSRFKGRKLILKRNRRVRKRFVKEWLILEVHKRIKITRGAAGYLASQAMDKTQYNPLQIQAIRLPIDKRSLPPLPLSSGKECVVLKGTDFVFPPVGCRHGTQQKLLRQRKSTERKLVAFQATSWQGWDLLYHVRIYFWFVEHPYPHGSVALWNKNTCTHVIEELT